MGVQGQSEVAPDLTEMMNELFFFGGGGRRMAGDDGEMRRKSSGRQTQEWLEEARKLVSNSPSRKLVGSPRFAGAPEKEKEMDPSAALDRRDPLSRSARRHRVSESISGEILSRSSARNHHRNSFSDEPPKSLPLLPSLPPLTTTTTTSSSRRKSRFQDDPKASPLPLPRRAFRIPSDFPVAAAAAPQDLLLSPPRNLVESVHRRSISSSTCSLEKIAGAEVRRRSVSVRSEPGAFRVDGGVVVAVDEDVLQINGFLRRQRAAMSRIAAGRASARAKIVLSGPPTTSTVSSMVAAICYAWLLENREKREGRSSVVVPVMNVKRGRMHKHRQAAWLFYHLGIDGSALLFCDEVNLEGLIMAKQLTVVVTGQDVLCTNSEVGSQCTVLTDDYCEDAYDLLQTPNLKKLLLAGILLDTRNLEKFAKFRTNRDAEAVQLLLVGSTPSFRNEFFENLMKDHKDKLFLEMLRRNYGNASPEYNDENGAHHEHKVPARKSTANSVQEVKQKQTQVLTPAPAPAPAPSPAPASAAKQTPEAAPRGKNKFSLAKLFGFGSR